MSITTSQVYVADQRLTDLSLFLGNDLENDFAAPWIAPERPVDKPSGEYNKWNRDHQKVVGNTLRPEGAEGAVVQFGFTQASYTANEYAIQTFLFRETSVFEDPGLDIAGSMPEFLRELELIDREVRLADVYDDTSYHDSGDNAVTLSGTDQWSDYTNSDPIADVETGRMKIWRKTGKMPNKAWMSQDVFSKLQYHPRITAKLGGAMSEKFATLADLQMIFQIPEIRVVKAVKNTAAYGATDAISSIWGLDFYMAYSQPATGLRIFTAGAHMARPLAMYPSARRMVETRYDGVKGIDWWRVLYAGTYNDISAGDGSTYMIKNAVATPS